MIKPPQPKAYALISFGQFNRGYAVRYRSPKPFAPLSASHILGTLAKNLEYT